MNSEFLIELIEMIDENNIIGIIDLYIFLKNEKGLGNDDLNEIIELEKRVNELYYLLEKEKIENIKLKEKLNEK